MRGIREKENLGVGNDGLLILRIQTVIHYKQWQALDESAANSTLGRVWNASVSPAGINFHHEFYSLLMDTTLGHVRPL